MNLKNIFLVATLIFISCNSLFASPIQIELNKEWKFKQGRLNNWYPATVPGVVHTDLIDNKIIEYPFFRLNERGLQWIDKEDWIYETIFDLSEDILNKNNIEILFKGLDTYADIYLNDEKILATDNMFRQWMVDIKGKVKSKENILRVYFHSPIKVDMPKWDALPFHYEASNDQSENGGLFNKKLSVFARKAGYHYGWDWGPRLVTSGIWRPVVINAWSDARINNVQVIQESVTAKEAKIKTIVEILSDRDITNVTLKVSDSDANKLLGSVETNLSKGLNKVKVDFTISNPKLWWSNTLGKPHLYKFNTEIISNNEVIDNQIDKIGIRSLRLVREKDKDGKSFYFELNGVSVFAKGANYIPCDNFLPRVTKNIYKKTVLDAVNANMNMLRVWGGGIYEEDYFYDLCDEYGILVWQDFMFACSIYPAEGEFLENIRLEAIDNVRRLRNHPSIAIWCGNNECQDAWFNWGWKDRHEKENQAHADKIWEQFKNQYYKVLPKVVEEYGSGIAYTPSSPFADYGVGSNDHEGDRHYWDVWHGKKPIADYNKEKSRFFSEYGFQSFPEFESVKIYAPEKEDWNITSEVMMAHQRGGDHANKLIESYLLNEYYTPKNFESFLYISQILQGDAIKIAIEAHRRDMGYCMGTLFWQHNDCWPVASWASRDYYGRWKAQHYFTRKAYDDILVSPIENNGVLDVVIVSDRLKNTNGTLTVKALNLSGKEISLQTIKLNIKANSSNKVFSKKLEELINDIDRSNIVIHAEFVGDKIYSNNYFLAKQKDINFPEVTISSKVESVDGGFAVTLTANKYARGVFMSIDGIDNFFEDNYFDILPGKSVTTKVATALSLSDFQKQFKIQSLADMR
ncbi:MAG: beta-mannosidase [Bacteroidales bacterium 45-6]|nr:MAG: beta-mannosidase [Bacteroidales bacterium 45-6]